MVRHLFVYIVNRPSLIHLLTLSPPLDQLLKSCLFRAKNFNIGWRFEIRVYCTKGHQKEKMTPSPNCDSSLDNVRINVIGVKEAGKRAKQGAQLISGEDKLRQLLLAIQLIDLTTLAGDDTYVNVQRLCYRALNPIKESILEKLPSGLIEDQLTTAAVCVFPSRVKDCAKTFDKLGHSVNIASVATGFPSGSYGLESRLKEIQYAVDNGANEIDIVLDRSLVLDGDWDKVHEEVAQMKDVCGQQIHMKAIIEAGELGSLENVYKASYVSMEAGADFVKTSTGKVPINATLPIGVVMTRAVWDYYDVTGDKVGFKPAGGLRTAEDSLEWLTMVRSQLGEDWINPSLLRFGASSLLNNIEKSLFTLIYNRLPTTDELSL